MSSATESPPPSAAAQPPKSAAKVFRAGLVGLVYLMNLDFWYWLTPRIEDAVRTMRVPFSPAAAQLINWSHFLRWHIWFSLPVLIGVGVLHAWAICQPGNLRHAASWLALALFVFFAISVLILFANGVVDVMANHNAPGH